MLANDDLAAADVDIGVAECGDDLRDRDIISVEFVQIDVDVVLLGRAAPRIHGHHPRHGEQSPRDDPVLHGAQVGQPEMRRADHLIAEHLADKARLLDDG